MLFMVIVSAALGAEPTPEQVKLLKLFREEFVAIEPGADRFPRSFTMGGDRQGDPSQAPAHQVTLKHSFQIARYEVPQNLWRAVMGTNPSRWKGERNSVEMLSFDDARNFCRRATELMRSAKLIEPQQIIRLPSEAEWEYACRAGTTTRYSFGDDVEQLGDYAWFTGNAKGNDPPVGAKKQNPWGLFDMHGYLWEWCLDTAHPDYSHAPDEGSAWTQGGRPGTRILRGGSWKDTASELTSAHRRAADETTRDDAVGLRCVLSRAEAATP